jgi:hypothetical protein
MVVLPQGTSSDTKAKAGRPTGTSRGTQRAPAVDSKVKSRGLTGHQKGDLQGTSSGPKGQDQGDPQGTSSGLKGQEQETHMAPAGAIQGNGVNNGEYVESVLKEEERKT